MIKQFAIILSVVAVALGGYGFFIAQRVVGWLYVMPAFFLLLIALVLFLIDYLLKKRNTKE